MRIGSDGTLDVHLVKTDLIPIPSLHVFTHLVTLHKDLSLILSYVDARHYTSASSLHVWCKLYCKGCLNVRHLWGMASIHLLVLPT